MSEITSVILISAAQQFGEMMADINAWLGLLRAPGVGSRTFAKLVSYFGSPAAVFAALPEQLQSLGLQKATLAYLAAPDWAAVERDLNWLAQAGNQVITLDDASYPALLKEIADPPPLLFVHGDASLLSMPQLAVVGSRQASVSGLRTARQFSQELAAAGLVMTSGLAMGVDAAAHEGALSAKPLGRTVAVTGTGLDQVYPAEHHDLAHRIAANGVLVSEFLPGTPPRASHFPQRNRIISGLSLGVLVIEASLHSGSLITARLAAEQGRQVFAIPGSRYNPLARGCHALIRQGAALVEQPNEILAELAPQLDSVLKTVSDVMPKPVQQTNDLASDYLQLLNSIGFDPIAIDILVMQSGLTAEKISSMLLLLELEGYVSSMPGGLYCRTDKVPAPLGTRI